MFPGSLVQTITLLIWRYCILKICGQSVEIILLTMAQGGLYCSNKCE